MSSGVKLSLSETHRCMSLTVYNKITGNTVDTVHKDQPRESKSLCLARKVVWLHRIIYACNQVRGLNFDGLTGLVVSIAKRLFITLQRFSDYTQVIKPVYCHCKLPSVRGPSMRAFSQSCLGDMEAGMKGKATAGGWGCSKPRVCSRLVKWGLRRASSCSTV